jgi:hypothetical protein
VFPPNSKSVCTPQAAHALRADNHSKILPFFGNFCNGTNLRMGGLYCDSHKNPGFSPESFDLSAGMWYRKNKK